ncbi:hypothetical protein TNCV_4233221 [Trichonephila clavipes]|nr:hypothetical protein TNCV_4233221 [Trichonephila clavipes]
MATLKQVKQKNRVKSGHRPFSLLTLLQHVEFTPALTFFPTCSNFWLDFPPVVRMACEIKSLESKATTGFFVLLGEQGNKAVLDWVMKEGLIPSRYECPKCKKHMRLFERKGTIDGFECRVQSKENPHFVCRSCSQLASLDKNNALREIKLRLSYLQGKSTTMSVIAHQTEKEWISANEKSRQRMSQTQADGAAKQHAARLEEAHLQAHHSCFTTSERC